MQKTKRYSEELKKVSNTHIVDSNMISSKLFQVVDAVKNNIIWIIVLKEYVKTEKEVLKLKDEVEFYTKMFIFIWSNIDFQRKIRAISVDNSKWDRKNEFINSVDLIKLYESELKK